MLLFRTLTIYICFFTEKKLDCEIVDKRNRLLNTFYLELNFKERNKEKKNYFIL